MLLHMEESCYLEGVAFIPLAYEVRKFKQFCLTFRRSFSALLCSALLGRVRVYAQLWQCLIASGAIN